jgi:dTDP-4-amino-4,6-dideoxygalactose transaminase
MRSSGGVRKQVKVSKTVNGRMSEAQAAYALMSLEVLDENIARNKSLHDIYAAHLQSIPGLLLHSAAGVSVSNHQQAVATVDERRYGISARALLRRLRDNSISALSLDFPAAPVIATSLARDLPGFAALAETGVELPLGSATSAHAIEEICGVLARFSRA